jgi:hypothetical protein
MKTDKLEKVLKRKFQVGKSIEEQTTKAELDEISFWSFVENIINAREHQRLKDDKKAVPLSESELETLIQDYGNEVLNENNNDFRKSLDSLI